jgi:transketolase
MADPSSLHDVVRRLRRRIIALSSANRIPHLGSCLSCLDLLAILALGGVMDHGDGPTDPNRDRLLLSKGHAAMALYAVLEARGLLTTAEVDAMNTDGALLAEHPPAHGAPGVEAATGSLGHGLGLAIGTLLAGRLQRRTLRTWVVMSDGELNEGSVWEAAMMASHHRLGGLTAVVDANGWQATGRTTEVLDTEPLADKWSSFGWAVRVVDGHDIDGLAEALAPDPERPKAVVARTIKGRGVSFMEDDNNWHYRIPNDDELARALAELEPA